MAYNDGEINKSDLLIMINSAPDDATFSGWDNGEIYCYFNENQWHIEKESLRWVRYTGPNKPIYASERGRIE